MLLMLCGAVLAAQDGASTTPDEVVFEREWPAQTVPYYRIVVRADGSGTVSTVKGGGEQSGGGAQAVRVSEATRARVFAVAPVVASGRCEGGAKHTAQTGQKTLVVRQGGKESQCTFNYSDDKRLQEAVAAFAGMEVTVEEGPKLERLLRFDRLGLDGELGTFVGLVKDGRAIEVQNLRPVLEKLAANPEVMERVRSRAAELLTMGDAGR